MIQDHRWGTLKRWISLLDEDMAERTAAVRLVQRDTPLVEGRAIEVRLPTSDEWFSDPTRYPLRALITRRQVLFFMQIPETDGELMDEVFRDFFPQTPFEILRPLSDVFRLIDVPRPRIDIGFVPSRHMQVSVPSPQALHKDATNRFYFSGYTDVSIHLALRSGRAGAAGQRTVLMATMLREPITRIAAQLAFLQEWRFAREKPVAVDIAESEVSRKIKLMQRRDELLLKDFWNGANWSFMPNLPGPFSLTICSRRGCRTSSPRQVIPLAVE